MSLLTLFRKVWAVYGVLLFLLMGLLSFPVMLANMALTPGKRALRRNIWYLHHMLGPTFLRLTGIRYRVYGRELFDPHGSYVIVANHSSSVDFVLNGAAFPGIFRFLAKQELLKVPIFGWIVGKMCLIVDRKSAMSRARSVVALKKELEEGVSVLIYPEGSRNRSGEPLSEFYDGAFRIAIQTGAPILPLTIANIRNVSVAAQSVDLSPGKVDIYFDAPIATTGMKGEDVKQLIETVRAKMLIHLMK